MSTGGECGLDSWLWVATRGPGQFSSHSWGWGGCQRLNCVSAGAARDGGAGRDREHAYLRLCPRLQGYFIHLLHQGLSDTLRIPGLFAGVRGTTAGLRATLVLSAGGARGDRSQAASLPPMLHVNVNFNT